MLHFSVSRLGHGNTRNLSLPRRGHTQRSEDIANFRLQTLSELTSPCKQALSNGISQTMALYSSDELRHAHMSFWIPLNPSSFHSGGCPFFDQSNPQLQGQLRAVMNTAGTSTSYHQIQALCYHNDAVSLSTRQTLLVQIRSEAIFLTA